MAKKINEKITSTHQLSIEGTLNLDNIGSIIADIEDSGETDITELIKKFNGEYAKLTLTVKTDQSPEE